MPIACGFLKMGKCLPVRYASVQLEITFANAEDAVATHANQHTAGAEAVAGSRNYVIQQLTVFCAQARLDSALKQSLAQLLLSN